MPGCALLQTKIYCYGGFTKYQINDYGPYYSNALNDHLTLHLQPLGNLSHFNEFLIQWKPVSNTYNGVALPNIGNSATATLSDNSYILYGGSENTFGNCPNLTYPFLHYDPKTDTFKTFPMLANNTYASRLQLVNTGNDAIWIWGGGLNSTGWQYTFDYGIFNYKTSSWSNMNINVGSIRIDHTATLAGNGLIYILGGYFKANETETIYLSEFSRMYTYDTLNSKWGNFNGNGQIPTNRGLHTTTASADGKSLLIYGGSQVLVSGLTVATDVFFIYDIASNAFSEVRLPKDELSSSNNNARFGHFATLYNSTYLILSFGYRDTNSPAESLSILNIADPKNPVWATALSAPDTPTDGSGGTDSKILIPAIVVPVVVVLLGAAVGLFFFIRHRRKQKENAFILEQQDPRNKESNPLDFMDTSTEKTPTEVHTNSVGRRSVEVTKPFMMEYDNQTATVHDSHSQVTDTSYQKPQAPQAPQAPQHWATKVELPNTQPVKPFDAGQ
ncbi:unnamed protein product [Cunninghamella echinulata]